MPTPNDVVFFYPGMSSLDPDGTMVMRASGYEPGGAHWSGVHRVAPADPDYAMWISFRDAFIANPPSLPWVSSEQLEAIRADWARERTKA